MNTVKINEHGELEIRRRGLWVRQYCMYVSEAPCAHWCPLWNDESPPLGGDPELGLQVMTNLEICSRIFEGLVLDERRSPPNSKKPSNES